MPGRPPQSDSDSEDDPDLQEALRQSRLQAEGRSGSASSSGEAAASPQPEPEPEEGLVQGLGGLSITAGAGARVSVFFCGRRARPAASASSHAVHHL